MGEYISLNFYVLLVISLNLVTVVMTIYTTIRNDDIIYTESYFRYMQNIMQLR